MAVTVPPDCSVWLDTSTPAVIMVRNNPVVAIAIITPSDIFGIDVCTHP
jgi:hypothetical protein